MELSVLLNKLGLKQKDIENILELVSNEIDYDELYKKIKYLIDIKCDIRIIKIILEENILFITTELKEIKKVVEYIKEKGLEEYLSDILEVEPEILSVSVEKIRENEKILRKIFPKYMINIFLRDSSKIFTFDSNNLENRLKLLINAGFNKEKLTKIIILDIEIFEMLEEEIDLEKLKESL